MGILVWVLKMPMVFISIVTNSMFTTGGYMHEPCIALGICTQLNYYNYPSWLYCYINRVYYIAWQYYVLAWWISPLAVSYHQSIF